MRRLKSVKRILKFSVNIISCNLFFCETCVRGKSIENYSLRFAIRIRLKPKFESVFFQINLNNERFSCSRRNAIGVKCCCVTHLPLRNLRKKREKGIHRLQLKIHLTIYLHLSFGTKNANLLRL